MFKEIYHLNVFYTKIEGLDNAALANECDSLFENEREMIETQNADRRLDGNNEHVKKLREAVDKIIKKTGHS